MVTIKNKEERDKSKFELERKIKFADIGSSLINKISQENAQEEIEQIVNKYVEDNEPTDELKSLIKYFDIHQLIVDIL